MKRSLNENFCANCGDLASKNMERSSVCTTCYVRLIGMFNTNELETSGIHGVMEEDELVYLLHCNELAA